MCVLNSYLEHDDLYFLFMYLYMSLIYLRNFILKLQAKKIRFNNGPNVNIAFTMWNN